MTNWMLGILVFSVPAVIFLILYWAIKDVELPEIDV